MRLVFGGDPQRACALSGWLKPVHAALTHGILVLPLLAWAGFADDWDDRTQARAVWANADVPEAPGWHLAPLSMKWQDLSDRKEHGDVDSTPQANRYVLRRGESRRRGRVVPLFVKDGVVRDEGGTFTGVAAIKQWNAGAREKYHHTVEPISAVERSGKIVVSGRVSGVFRTVR